MGTNYYHETGVCEQCGLSEQRRHIGKSSFGWCFSLHVEPDEADFPHSWDDWPRELTAGGRIVDEYRRGVELPAFVEVVTNRGNGRYCSEDWFGSHSWIGYDDETDFHRCNQSQRGPKGLMRHRIDEGHCIGHGEGTWDLIRGEFS